MKNGPRVAIVGRPNVGKSTLFNRIAGTRRAIVDPVAGSTRDRNLARASWSGKEFELVDTGGLFDRPETPIDEQVAEQVGLAIRDADVICWVVDARVGLVPEDRALAARLRSDSERVLVAVNKVDRPEGAGLAADFYELGFPEVHEISAEHGFGVAELLDEIVARLPSAPEPEPDLAEIRVAIVGRPNVGKSSLLNRLAGEQRAVVSETAGTTRDAIDTLVPGEGRSYRFVDTAGIRRRGKTPSRADELGILYAQRAIQRAHVCLLVLDAVQGVTTEDASIAGRIADAGRGAVLVFNKWDLVGDREERAAILKETVEERMHHLAFAPVVFVSALTGRHLAGILPLVDRVRDEQLRRIPTPELNRFLEAIAAQHPPRSKGGKEVRLLYMTQTGTAPPRFVVFANRVRDLDPAYPRFVIRRLREEFGFAGTPIRLKIRERR